MRGWPPAYSFPALRRVFCGASGHKLDRYLQNWPTGPAFVHCLCECRFEEIRNSRTAA